ncbi:MAG: hypothetical protein H7257_00160 [Taibaiella sp.]|nr:hypothetical protein [Taibaiella sp.]
MKRIFLIVLLTVSPYAGLAQVPVNNPIDPSDTPLNQGVKFLIRYFNEFTPGRLPDFRKYWSAEDCAEFKYPDQLLFAINTQLPTYLLGRPLILSARPENEIIHIKTMFSRVDSAGGLLVFSITNHYINRNKDGSMFFINPMRMVAGAWETKTVRNITYRYPSYHTFNKQKALHLAKNIIALEKEWQLPPVNIRYFFADAKEEIEHFRGFDFTIAMGNRDKPSGISDGIDNIVYCGGWGENYFHEVVHIYLNRFFPGSPLTEGLAVFYGGSLGHDLPWHLNRVDNYLRQHPEINLQNLDDFYYIDNFTNPTSTIVGMFCLDAYRKGGVEALKKMIRYPTIEELIRSEYGVSQDGWNNFLRNKINEMAR